MNKKTLQIGCIADDFTGASDVASFLASSGLNTVLYNGVPLLSDIENNDSEAVVIALKTRTMKTINAVKLTTKAAKLLNSLNCKIIYEKYCSTFDSTKEGNIGPISDALLELQNQQYTVICPSLPINGRIVKDGKLYVLGKLLSESPMKNHPLTPMKDSDLSRLMQMQSKYKAFILNRNTMNQSKSEILDYIEKIGKGLEHFYIIPEFETDQDSIKIANTFSHLNFFTGGSKLPMDLVKGTSFVKTISAKTKGKAIILVGSCSAMSRKQIKHYQSLGGYSYRINQFELLNGNLTFEKVYKEASRNNSESIMIYSSGSPEELALLSVSENKIISKKLEKLIASISKMAVDNGFTRIIVAGGETSGAVVQKLSLSSYIISENVAPGVPVMIPIENRDLRIVLKSGNFGELDFFNKAVELTRLN